MAGHSNKMLKNLTNCAQNMILDLFDECLKKNKIPEEWRTSNITMIPKKVKITLIQ